VPKETRNTQQILSAPKFRQLRSQRAFLRWTLSLATLAMFFGIIVLDWTARSALSADMPGTSTPIWFGLIIGMTLAVVALTGIYVHQSNSRFDRLTHELIREIEQ
jgi:uncharacterized membrane protein (DUF485 family)